MIALIPPLDIVVRLREVRRRGHICAEAAAEIERLRAALQEIAEDPGGYPAEDAFTDLQEIARAALRAPCDDAEFGMTP